MAGGAAPFPGLGRGPRSTAGEVWPWPGGGGLSPRDYEYGRHSALLQARSAAPQSEGILRFLELVMKHLGPPRVPGVTRSHWSWGLCQSPAQLAVPPRRRYKVCVLSPSGLTSGLALDRTPGTQATSTEGPVLTCECPTRLTPLCVVVPPQRPAGVWPTQGLSETSGDELRRPFQELESSELLSQRRICGRNGAGRGLCKTPGTSSAGCLHWGCQLLSLTVPLSWRTHLFGSPKEKES